MRQKNTIQKVITALAGACMLCGCSANAQPKRSYIQPVTANTEYAEAFTEKGKEILSNTYGEFFPAKIILNVGKELPDFQLKEYKGEEFSLKDEYTGKKTVIEVGAYWADYFQTQTRDNTPEIIAANPDIEWLTYFIDGSEKGSLSGDNMFSMGFDDVEVDTIEMMYQTLGIEHGTERIAEENDAFSEYVEKELMLTGVPAFFFFDETGKLSFAYEGVMSAEKFASIRTYAFDDGERLYNEYKGEYATGADFLRTWEDVKADIPEDTQKTIAEMNDSEENAYSNIGLPFTSVQKAIDLNNNVYDPAQLKGVTVYVLLDAADTNNDDYVREINAFAENSPKNTSIITALYVQESEDVVATLRGIKSWPDTMILMENNLPTELRQLTIGSYPCVVFVDNDNDVIMGSFEKPVTYAKISDYYSLLCGLYKD